MEPMLLYKKIRRQKSHIDFSSKIQKRGGHTSCIYIRKQEIKSVEYCSTIYLCHVMWFCPDQLFGSSPFLRSSEGSIGVARFLDTDVLQVFKRVVIHFFSC